MSAFFAKCPDCGVVYYHCFIGNTLVSGHCCERSKPAAFTLNDEQEALITAQRDAISRQRPF